MLYLHSLALLRLRRPRHKLRIVSFCACTKAHSLRCSSASHRIFHSVGALTYTLGLGVGSFLLSAVVAHRVPPDFSAVDRIRSSFRSPGVSCGPAAAERSLSEKAMNLSSCTASRAANDSRDRCGNGTMISSLHLSGENPVFSRVLFQKNLIWRKKNTARCILLAAEPWEMFHF